MQEVSLPDAPTMDAHDVEATASVICEITYNACHKAQSRSAPRNMRDAQSSWERVTSMEDPKELWRAIVWDG